MLIDENIIELYDNSYSENDIYIFLKKLKKRVIGEN